MPVFLNILEALFRDGRGVTALEYGLMVGLIALAILTSMNALGTALTGTFNILTADLP